MRNNKGFTILELAFVLVIVAIISALAVHVISSEVPGKHLSGAARTLHSDLNNAKIQALQDGVQYQVRVTASGDGYAFYKGTLSSGTDFSTITTPETTKTLLYPEDVTLSGGPFVFDPRGTASSTADIVLTNSEGDTRTIAVTLAGRIRSS